jgi:hypothetical protein
MKVTLRLGVLAVVSLVMIDAAFAQRPPARPQRVDSLTSSIRGRVTTSDTGAPIRGAEVRLSSDGRFNRLVRTNDEGRYELRDLPAGTYKLVVSRTGFITLEYGQRRPFEASSTITLAEGQSAAANVALIRGGAIFGRVFDQSGEPLAGTRVQAFRTKVVEGRRRLQAVGSGDQTDDTGAFRVYGLPPGDYYVAASTGLVDAVKRDPPIYFPGTANFAEAQPIRLGVGAEANAEFQLVTSRTTRISGIVLNSSGGPAAGAQVNLQSQTIGMGPESSMMLHAEGASDGTFTIQNVPPGPYVLTAMIMPAGVFGQPQAAAQADQGGIAEEALRRMPEMATLPIVVGGDELSGITLAAGRNGRVNGTFVADAGVARPVPTGLGVNLRSLGNISHSMTLRGNGPDFRLAGMSGAVNLQIQGVPEDWMVKSILADGTDVTDEGLDLNGDTVAVRVVLTDRITSVTGTVQGRGEIRDHNVLVFPDDETKWKYQSRYVRTTRADADGRFQIRGLPPSDRYLAVALDYLEDGEQDDPQFLDRLRSRATSFNLREGEQRSLQLDVSSR